MNRFGFDSLYQSMPHPTPVRNLPQLAATFFHRIQPYSFIILVAAVYLNLFDFFFYPAQIILSLIEFAPIFFIGG